MNQTTDRFTEPDRPVSGLGGVDPYRQAVQDVVKEIHHRYAPARIGSYLFESTPSDPSEKPYRSDYKEIGPPIIFPLLPQMPGPMQKQIEKLAQHTASSQLIQYPEPAGSLSPYQSVIAIPVPLAAQITAVIVLIFPENRLSVEDCTSLEGSIPQWTRFLSLHYLKSADAFSHVMCRLRKGVADSRSAAIHHLQRLPHTDVFSREMLVKISDVLNACDCFMVLQKTCSSGPDMLHTIICRGTGTGTFPVVEEVSIIHDRSGPFINGRRDVLIFSPFMKSSLPDDIQREWERLMAKARLLSHSATESAPHEKPDSEHQSRSLIVCSFGGEGGMFPSFHAVLMILIPGIHYFDQMRIELIRESGELISGALHQMALLDRDAAWERHRTHINTRAKAFEKAGSHDEIMGTLLGKLGYPPDNAADSSAYWGLADHAAIWLIADDTSELILRSSRGHALDTLKDTMILPLHEHPLLNDKTGEPPDLDDTIFRIRSFRIHHFFIPHATDRITQSYGARFPDHWLISFPLMDAARRLYGVMDIIRPAPLLPEESSALEELLEDLAHLICSMMERCRHRQTLGISEKLYGLADQHLRALRVDDVLEAIVQELKLAFDCLHCDLFLFREGVMMLEATTRSGGPESNREKFQYVIQASDDAKEALGLCYSRKSPILLHKERDRDKPVLSHLSPVLSHLTEFDHRHERIAVPLHPDEKKTSDITGILYIVGQQTVTPDGSSRVVHKKSGRFTSQDVRIVSHLATDIRRIIRMVEMVERQGLLGNMLVHSLGQPLQLLRFPANELLRIVVNAGLFDDTVKKTRDRLNRAFDLVDVAREQLSMFTKLSQPDRRITLDLIGLSGLLKECCDFMAPIARETQKQIVYGNIKRIQPLPIERRWMRIALINILENACKYSFTSRTIPVSLWETDGVIVMKIVDFGVGIPPEDLQRIFEPYYRSRVPDRKGVRVGTGIGLTIVKEAVERIHLGEVSAESDPIHPGDSRLDRTRDDIVNIEHETRFIIKLYRQKLMNQTEIRE